MTLVSTTCNCVIHSQDCCAFALFSLDQCWARADDPNDFNNLAMAQVVIEDAYVWIMTIDGEEYVDKLRAKLNRASDETIHALASNEESFLLSKP
jgi:hypothetical protein